MITLGDPRQKPFRHLLQDDFLPPELLTRAVRAFQDLDRTEFSPHPTGYEFAICRDLQILQFLYSPRMRAELERVFGRAVKRSVRYPVPQFYDFPVESRGLRPHTDADEKRDLAMIIYLAEDWAPDAGGELVVMSSETETDRVVEPILNRAAILELHPGAWHSVRPTQKNFRRRTLIVDWDFV